MKASVTLPRGYSERGEISLQKKAARFWLNLLAVPWFLGCAFFFGSITSLLRPLDFGNALPRETPLGPVGTIAILFMAILSTLCVTIILHELTHGLFFWLFTKSHPRFGFKGWYIYATAPGWYLPRGQSLIVGSAPLIFLSFIGAVLLLLVPQAMVLWILWGLVVNAGGAIGDLYMIARLVFISKVAVVEASDGKMTWYEPTKKLAILEKQQELSGI